MSKNITNPELAELLRDVAAAYQLKGGSNANFKRIAYERAADAIEHLSSEAKDIWDEGKLEDISGVGKSMAEHLDELFKTGRSKHFDELLGDLPDGMFKLMKVTGIGPKTAYKLTTEFKITKKHPFKDVLKLAENNKIAQLEGYGAESQQKIVDAIHEHLKKPKERILLPQAQHIANEIIEYMKENINVGQIDTLGSLRRKASTIGDIDLSVATNKPTEVLEHFVNYKNVSRVLGKGEFKASVIMPGNIQVDLMVQPPDAYGALLQHFTGSKHHNIALREYALKHKMSLSERGIKKGKKIHKMKTEKEFYNFLGMQYIPPILREGGNEIKAALDKKLPKVVELSDIKGDLQMHTNFDIETSHDVGSSSMKQMLQKADELGYEYIAFTEHNPSQRNHNQKQIKSLLSRKKDQIDQINSNMKSIVKNRIKKVFNSLEIDMLPDGSLPVSEENLELLDFALVSIHSSFRQSRAETTKRVLSALSHPKVQIFAHPTGRKLNHREGVEIDWEKVFDFCLKNNKWIEINAEPQRLDLPDFLVLDAVKKGVKLTLGTDAHGVDGMDNMKWGVYVAQRGWATKQDVINTRSLAQFEKMLK